MGQLRTTNKRHKRAIAQAAKPVAVATPALAKAPAKKQAKSAA